MKRVGDSTVLGIKNSRGFSIISTMIAAGIGALIISAISSALVSLHSEKSKLEFHMDKLALSAALIQSLSNVGSCNQSVIPGFRLDVAKAITEDGAPFQLKVPALIGPLGSEGLIKDNVDFGDKIHIARFLYRNANLIASSGQADAYSGQAHFELIDPKNRFGVKPLEIEGFQVTVSRDTGQIIACAQNGKGFETFAITIRDRKSGHSDFTKSDRYKALRLICVPETIEITGTTKVDFGDHDGRLVVGTCQYRNQAANTNNGSSTKVAGGGGY